MPGGIPLTQEAERHLSIAAETRLLGVACGTGEIECYFAEKYGCTVLGIDLSEASVARARSKSRARGLEALARFQVGDGNALQLDAETFDLVYCSGALCDYLDKGLAEFHRVLRPGGRAVVIDVIWRRDDVPPHIEQYWSVGATRVMTLAAKCQAFAAEGFSMLFAQVYDEPSWWEAYYQDREPSTAWQRERAKYQLHQNYVGVGLFVAEKA